MVRGPEFSQRTGVLTGVISEDGTSLSCPCRSVLVVTYLVLRRR